jgi:hypothetical protein
MAALLFYIPKAIPLDSNGALLSGAKANFFISGTTTRQDTFNAKTLNVAHPNPVVADGNGVFPPIYLDDTLNYKLDLTDSTDVSLPGYPVDNLASNSGLVADLASTANAKGASLIGIEDAAANFTATDVEAALAEILSDLASVANGLGGSLVGFEDAANKTTAATVEAALAELFSPLDLKVKTGTEIKNNDTSLADDAHFFGWALDIDKVYSLEAYIDISQNIGDIKFLFQFSNAPQQSSYLLTSQDESLVIFDSYSSNITTQQVISSMTDTERYGLKLKGSFISNAVTGGTVDFQWAQNTSSANFTSLFFGSWMSIKKLD